MRNLFKKIIILSAVSILLSCESMPINYSAYQSWLMPKRAMRRIWTTMTVLGVHVDKNGGWDSIEGEAALLAPLYFWDKGCRVVTAEEGPQYAARIWIRERDFYYGWKSRKSLAVEVRIWNYEDAPVNGTPFEDFKLPAAVGRVVMIGDKSFSSSDIMGKLLSRAITQAVRKLTAYKDKRNV